MSSEKWRWLLDIMQKDILDVKGEVNSDVTKRWSLEAAALGLWDGCVLDIGDAFDARFPVTADSPWAEAIELAIRELEGESQPRGDTRWHQLLGIMQKDILDGKEGMNSDVTKRWALEAEALGVCAGYALDLGEALDARFPTTKGASWEDTVELAIHELERESGGENTDARSNAEVLRDLSRSRLKKPSNHKARLTYFKGTGKFYGEGELDVLPEEQGQGWYKIFERVDALLEPQRLPGLQDREDRCCFIVSIHPPEGADYGYPALTNIEHAFQAWSR